MQTVSAYCSANNIDDIDDFIYKCFKQGFDIKKYGLLGKTLNEGEKHLNTGGIEEKQVEIEVIKEIRVEVPVEVVKYVEVPVEIIKEVEVIQYVDREVVKEVPVEIIKEKIVNVIQEVLVPNIDKIGDELKSNDKVLLLQETLQKLRKELTEKNIVYYDDPTYNWHIIFPEKPFSKDKISILVAGCGTEQAAIIAKLSPQHEVIGIDLSSNSLKHQQKLIDKHKINNLKLICGDFRKIKFDKKFDLIISTGVIHHLEDPGSALKYFYNNIKYSFLSIWFMSCMYIY